VCPAQSVFDFDTALTRSKENIEALFAGIRVDRYGQIAFYPSHLRNIVMEAANRLTVMDVTYDGHRRQVEPYSLVFKRRKDGFGQEYFYAYDRTEGRTSGPGLKSFLHPKIQALTTTEERFEPRMLVELGNAGEFAGKTYFGGNVLGGFSTRVRRRTSITRLYLVECSYCGKRFPSKRRNTRLRPHKDQYGNDCYGRSGYIAY
jgi:hypothetical protein